MSEYIEPHIKKVIQQIIPTDLAYFRRDWKIYFKRVPDKSLSRQNMFQKRKPVPFMTKMWKNVFEWSISSPPYGHPVLNKKIKTDLTDYNTKQ